MTSYATFHVLSISIKKGCDNISAIMAESNRTSKIVCKSCCEVRNDSDEIKYLPNMENVCYLELEILMYLNNLFVSETHSPISKHDATN